MKLRITMKDPDGPYECIRDAARESLMSDDLTEEEREMLLDGRVKQLKQTTSKFLEYGEYIEVEFDTDLGTATVIPCR